MGIRVRDSVQFGNLLKALADEIVDAQIHFKLYQDLVACYKNMRLNSANRKRFGR